MARRKRSALLPLRIAGTGAFLPAKTLTNEDLARFLDTSDEWIRTRTGIRLRHVLAEGEVPAQMGVAAAGRALAMAGKSAAEVDLLLAATNVPEEPIPGTAPHLAAGLGLKKAPFLDVTAGCAGFLYALALAGAWLRAGLARTALVVGTEAPSRFVDWSDRATCVLFGDGAGAVVLERSAGGSGILGLALRGDPAKLHLLRIEAGGVRLPASGATVQAKKHYLQMEGKGLFRAAVGMMAEATRAAAAQAGLSLQDIDWVIPHQANLRIIEALTKRLGLPEGRVVVNIDRVANTSTASIPIALDELVRAGKVEGGQILALTAFGAGASYGTVILRW
ncbi:MAG: ketoacyl-ACP synthase III [Candidatus Bipolaricaulota bacterium]|nr:ketoacyl-ACP synthase III [Candidatus Bipolaricaulota bacterium]MCX7844612.1 ketoacyl-ACP synthase III [Candidatus Bipolaricaulota bacterium]MDW8152121.1 beta-ketoacyl-ACP synthase III [Candidatus Bipolaricaulota bacterium]